VSRPSPRALAASAVARAFLHSTWLACALRLLKPQPRPEEADPLAPPTIETSILRLPLSIANELRACTSVLEGLEPGHYYYPPESMHITLAAPGSGGDGRSAVEDVRAIAPRLVGARARVIGVGLSNRTLFAAIVADPSLAAARLSLRRAWGQSRGSLVSDLVSSRVWHANIVRFRTGPSRHYLARARRFGSLHSAWFDLPAVE